MNTIADYIDGTATCDVCGKSCMIADDRPVSVKMLSNAGWWSSAEGWPVYIGGGDTAPLMCPDCQRM
jgi:hypothetical protein